MNGPRLCRWQTDWPVPAVGMAMSRRRRIMKHSIPALAALVAMTFLAPVQASAETEAMSRFMDRVDEVVEDVMQSCKSEAEKFCSTVTPGKGRLLMCALAHGDQLSGLCASAVFDAIAELGGTISNMQLAVQACSADIESSCGSVEPGEGRVAQCLIDNKAKVSEPCREAVDVFMKNNP
jgi:hypothetical protein